MPRIPVLLLVASLFACSSQEQSSGLDLLPFQDVTDLAGESLMPIPDILGDAAFEDATREDIDEEKPVGEVFTYTSAAGLTGLSKGVFEEFSYEYPAIDVPASMDHSLTFLVTPMMPPWRREARTHGPLILFSQDLEVWVFSPMDHFFISLISFENGQIRLGIEGEIDALPAGFQHRFLLVKGHGIRQTVLEWGRLLREAHGKSPVSMSADDGLSRLSYWTDNGAYYYYKTAPGLNEQETLLAVKQEAETLSIPYGSFQLDSWWYFKEDGSGFGPGGLLVWEPIPEMFPEGLSAFRELLGLPLTLHNRWFSPNSPYVEQYPFTTNGEMSFPADGSVYDHFASNAASWGAITYEQDWLVSQFWGVDLLRTDPFAAHDWMTWMDDATASHGLTMQLCMAGAAHLMQSVEMRAPTTIRTSIDYAAGISKESFWPQFHTVNLLAWALGIWPFKDNFQSSEPHGLAEALIAALSGGPVGIGDGLGVTRGDIVLRTCRQDGLLLKPDHPAVPIDAWFLDHERPLIVTTESSPDGIEPIVYIAAFHLSRNHPERTPLDNAFAVIQYDERDLNDMFVFPDLVTEWWLDLNKELGLEGTRAVLDWRTGEVTLEEGRVSMQPREALYDFNFLVVASVASNGLAFFGELDKFVTASRLRFPAVLASSDALGVSVVGSPGELVMVSAYDTIGLTWLPEVAVTLDSSGQGIAQFRR